MTHQGEVQHSQPSENGTPLYDYAKQAGQWFQGRGQNAHGVTAPDKSAIQDPSVEYTTHLDNLDDIPEVVEQAADFEPTPVYIVNPVRPAARRRVRMLSPSIAPTSATARPTMILGQDETRLRATVAIRTGADPFYISHDPNMTAAESFEVTAANGAYTTESTDPLYALTSDTDFQRISVAIEYTSDH